ncbi:MAG: fatty acid--CoA ligase family protein [Opitutaceae bacterium]|nr:fatty acid--CoA ligase family protein [Opitutaceae bacterium]
MNAALEKPWWIDGRSGASETYATLLAQIRTRAAAHRPCCQPASAREALIACATTIACDAEQTLFDADFNLGEIEALGFLPSDLQRTVTLSRDASISLESLKEKAAGGSRARLGLFTSGSTGLPRRVWQPAANLARAVKVSPRHAEAVWALAYNPTHVAGLQVCLQALANGCTLVDVRDLERAAVFAAIERHGVSHLSATPSFYRLLLPADCALAGVRSVTLGGESADAGLIEKLKALFPAARVHNVYASTEAGTLLTSDGDLFGIAPGLEGSVVVRGGTLHVHRNLLGEFDGGATGGEWYDTGDAVVVERAAPLRFRIVARERDWINVGGRKVNPHEVEAVLAAHPAVVQARVFGRKNSVLGQVLCAEVVARGAAPAEAALREFAEAQLQPFKVPRMIRFVDNIASTRTGKVARA